MVYFKDEFSSSGQQNLIILDDESQPLEKGTTLATHTPLIGRYAKQWPRMTTPVHTEQWSREVSLSKTSKVWSSQVTHHCCSDEQSFLPTLGCRIIEGKAKWGDNIHFAGEFRFIKGFWEWTEDVLSRCKDKLVAAQVYDAVYASLFTYDRNSDIVKAFYEAWCPSTNTLLTSFGELSISLWGVHTLVGLPMAGLLYDEVIPSAKELNGVDETEWRLVPRSCKFLLHAYHLLQKSNNDGQSSQVHVDELVKFWLR